MRLSLGAAFATAIMVTTLSLAQSYHSFRPGKHVAYILGASGPVNLNTLIPAGSGFTLTDSIAINNNDQILCDASTPASPKHAVLLSPK